MDVYEEIPENNFTKFQLVELAETSLLSAERQITRFWETRLVNVDHLSLTESKVLKALEKKFEFPNIGPQEFARQALSNDIALNELHFFFVSIYNIARYLKAVRKLTVVDNLKMEIWELTNSIAHYQQARNVFEHLDEKLPGQPQENKIKDVVTTSALHKITFGIDRTKKIFKHSNREWDISQNNFETIRNSVQLLIDKLKKEFEFVTPQSPAE